MHIYFCANECNVKISNLRQNTKTHTDCDIFTLIQEISSQYSQAEENRSHGKKLNEDQICYSYLAIFQIFSKSGTASLSELLYISMWHYRLNKTDCG